jgi:LacI family transcriptional regulator
MSITIRDVAVAAGVSAMSVSKVLHGKGPNVRVSPATATHIRETAERLDYRANRLARSFRERRTRTIGLLFETKPLCVAEQYFAEVLEGVIDSAFNASYTVSLCPSLVAGETIQPLSDGRFDGIVWSRVVSTDDRLAAVEQARVPVVVLHECPQPDRPNAHSHVTCDNDGALAQAIDHLVHLGHRSIAFVAAKLFRRNRELQARESAYLRAMAERNLPAEILTWSQECEEFANWWAAPKETTAVIVWAEHHAIQLIAQADRAGVRLPEELSVVGFDSTIRCDVVRPALTSVRQPIREMAAEATQILIDTIDGHVSSPVHSVHPCGFDVRESTTRPFSMQRKLSK